MLNVWGFLAALAWPAATLACVWLLRTEVRLLLGRLTRVRSPLGDVIFREEIAEALKEVGQQEIGDSGADNSAADARTISDLLADTNPRSAILDGWAAVERSLRVLAREAQLPLASRGSPLQLQRELRQQGILSEESDYLLNQLRPVRNSAAHNAEIDFSAGFARAYVRTALETAEKISAESIEVAKRRLAGQQ